MKNVVLALGIVLVGLFGLALLAGAHASAATPAVNDACQGIGLAGGGCGDSGAQLNNAVRLAVNTLSIIVGVIAVIMIIVGGLTYITSNGESPKIAKAKSSIIYALVGLVLIAAAESIVHFVIGKAK